ncbi:MAG: aldehyde ferredoxin oxidoreductase family protein [Candidatus Saliniplasma sp.]
MSGHWGKLLRVDLNEGSANTEELSEDFLKKFIGGAGFTGKVLYDEVGPEVDPLSEENKLIIAPGLLVGPNVPTGSKTTFGFKSPQTGGYGKSLVGGKIGAELKKAGFDILVVEGKTEKPSILIIEDDEVTVEEAGDIWGKDTHEAGDMIKDRFGDVETAVIGPAGEELSKISIIECNERQAARGGIGAVMGSKNLKGIGVSGTKDYPIHDKERMDELISKFRKETVEQGKTDMDYGSGEALHPLNVEIGAFPVNNWKAGYFKEAYEKLDDPEAGRIDIDPRKWAEEYRDGRRPCPYCTKPCSQYFVAEDTPYGDIAIDGPEYETQYSLGGCCGVDDVEAVAKANEICDKLGLDTISAGVTVAWAMEAYENGLLDTDIELNFGNAEGMINVIEKMGKKEGKLGKMLFNGVKEAAEKLGKGSEEFAIHIKGMEPPGYEARGMFGMGLALAVAPRGADHLTSCAYALDYGGSFWYFDDYERREIVSKGFPLKMMEDLMMIFDITGICKFSRGIYLDKKQVGLVNSITGWNVSNGDLLEAGERAHNVAKAYNVREGFTREDDVLPERMYREEVPYGPNKGAKIQRRNFEKALDRYYTARGWSLEGVPTKGKLENLDLTDVAEEVGATKQ